MTMCSSSSIAFLLLALSSLSASVDSVNVNIDCGSSTSYADGNDVEWVGDGDYTKSGKSMKVSNLKSDHVMDTLRVFSTSNKNCYSIPSVSRQKLLVRASFYYGNYDSKSSPPTFDLLLQGNHWATVQTSTDRIVRSEAIYVVKGSSVDVCVFRTSPSLIPFMTALEIRSMSTDTYKHSDTDTALIMRDRAFFSDHIRSDNGVTIASRKILTAQYYPPFGTPPADFPFPPDRPLGGYPVEPGLLRSPAPPAKSIIDKVMERKIMGVTIPIGLIVLVVMVCYRCTCGREKEYAVSADATRNNEQGGGPSDAKVGSEVEMADKSNYKDEAVLLANDQLKTRGRVDTV